MPSEADVDRMEAQALRDEEDNALTEPYRKCIEDVHYGATRFVEAMRELSNGVRLPDAFTTALIAAESRLKSINAAIDRHGIRDHLDIQ